ncbi:MAG: hypothetical protein QM682_08385 [Paracoccus sp. (in: a-proteobacteria)]|uniref:hypothetical protein n=1 Tax=Paracoccus sp. TaxID=267 RepID=UPI0039E241EF
MIRFALPSAAPEIAPPRAYATIAVSAHQSAQGPVLREYRDGRVVIDTGQGRLTGLPMGVRPVSEPIWSPLFAGLV